MALDLGDLVVHLEAATAEFRKNMQGASASFSQLGGTVAKIGAGIAATMGAALVGVGVASTKMAMDFEKNMKNVGTLLGKEGSARVEALGEDIKKMAAATGKPLEDLAGGMYQVISAFGDSADSSKILEISAKASTAGLAETQSAVDLLSSVTKGYGDTTATAVQKVSDLAFQTVKLGQTTFPELAASMGKAVPLAATLGVNMESLFGAMSTLTGVTGNTAEVATQLRATMQALINPSKEMQAVFDKLGISSGAAAVESMGFQNVLTTLKNATGGNTAQLADMFGSVEALNSVLALTGPQAADFTAKTAAMGNAAGETSAAFDIQQQSVAASMERIKQSLSVVAVNLGEKFLPILAKLAEWVAEHMPEIQKVFDATFTVIDTGIGLAKQAFEILGKVWSGLVSGWTGGNKDLQGTWGETAAQVGEVAKIIWRVISKLVEAVQVVWAEWGDEIMAIAKVAFGAVVATLKGVFQIIEGILDVFIGLFTGDWKRMRDGLVAVWDGLWDAVEAILKGAWDILGIAFAGLGESIGKWFSKLVDDALGWGSDMMRGFWNGITGWFGRIFDALGGFVSGMVNYVKDALDIHSPSGVFEEIGTQIGGGLAIGIAGTEGIVAGAMDGVTSMLQGKVSSAVASVSAMMAALARSVSIPIPVPVVTPIVPVAPASATVPVTPAQKTGALETAKAQAKAGNVDAGASTLSQAFGIDREQAVKNLAPFDPTRGGGGPILRLAEGGVTNGPTFAQIGEAGREAITPLTWLADQMQAFAKTIMDTMGAQTLAPLARLDNAFSGFNARVGQAVAGTFGGYDAAMAGAGAGSQPVVNVFIGERQLEDIHVEMHTIAVRRGRI